MSQQQYSKPLPTPQPESDFYWAKAREHQLWLRRCDDCRKAYFYPRDICPDCFSRSTSWVQSSGKGAVHTFAIVHRTAHPAFQDDAPYVVAIVEMEDGVRIPTSLVGVEPDSASVRVGMPVEVTFDDVTEELTLPKFRPASA